MNNTSENSLKNQRSNRKLVSIVDLFEALRNEMLASLNLDRDLIMHNVSKGDASETKWINFLRTYLPPRYNVDKGIVINKKGETSDQIDIVIYEAANAPFVFQHNNFRYIPVECVRAVLEVKQSMNARFIQYTKKKVESVRNLVDNADAKGDRNIKGGFLALEYDSVLFRENTNKKKGKLRKIDRNIKSEDFPIQHLNCGCCLRDFSFSDWYGYSRPISSYDTSSHKGTGVKYVTNDHLLVAFIFRLTRMLSPTAKEENILDSYMNNLEINFDKGVDPLF